MENYLDRSIWHSFIKFKDAESLVNVTEVDDDSYAIRKDNALIKMLMELSTIDSSHIFSVHMGHQSLWKSNWNETWI
jgi:hypothetical protein